MATKLNRKQLQQRQKAKTICKWVLCGLGWSVLLAGFISLVVVGVRGCANKKQTPATAITTPVKPQQPNNVVNMTNTTTGESGAFNQYAPRFEVLVGASVAGNTFAEYYWDSNMDDLHNIGNDTGNIFVYSSSTLGHLYIEETADLGYYENYAFTGIRHYSESSEIQFLNNSDIIYRIDERDFSQAQVYNSIRIRFEPFSFEEIEGNSTSFMLGLAGQGVINGERYTLAGIDNLLLEFMSYEVVYVNNPSDNLNGLEGAFGLISRAFTAIANFLNIQIIPGITFGTLFAVPIIATLILFIVWLFKR